MASKSFPHTETDMSYPYSETETSYPSYETSSAAVPPPPPHPPVRHNHGGHHYRSHPTERHDMNYYPSTYHHSDPNGYHPSSYWCPPHYRTNSWYHQPSQYFSQPGAPEAHVSETSQQLPEAFIPPRHEYIAQAPPTVTPIRGAAEVHLESQPRTPHDDAAASPYPDVIWNVRPSDVLCGRGAPTNYSVGNEEFRKVVKDYQTVYLCSKRSDKPRIAAEVLQLIRSRGGRFLRRVKTSHHGRSRYAWEEIAEQRAYEKICQALREGAPELRRQMMATSKIKGVPEKENFPSSTKHNESNYHYHHDDSHPDGCRG